MKNEEIWKVNLVVVLRFGYTLEDNTISFVVLQYVMAVLSTTGCIFPTSQGIKSAILFFRMKLISVTEKLTSQSIYPAN